MNARCIALLVVAAVGLGMVAGHVIADSHEEKGGGAAPAYTPPTPGDEHKELATFAGNWSAEMTYWMNGQAMPPSNDSESAKMIMNGWFLETAYSGTMMGQPWKGRALVGFDQRAKEYIQVWIYEMSSEISIHRGMKCPKGIIHLHGKSFNMQTQKMEPSVFMHFPPAEDGSRKMEAHFTTDKKPTTKIMQIIYKKK